ncbi:MAG: ComEC/Rec2 family competence protein [Robiginitomaculum sp.]
MDKLKDYKMQFANIMAFAGFEWALVSFSIGIAVYFVWPKEPLLFSCAVLGAVCFTCLVLSRKHAIIYDVILLLTLLVMGFGRAAYHTKAVAGQILRQERTFYTVTGWIERADQSKTMETWYIRVFDMKGRKLSAPPKRIRLRTKPHGFIPGDALSINAMLTAPPGPAIVGGYDSARRAYYRGIGGYGFAVSIPKAIDIGTLPLGQRLARKLVKARYALSRRIQARAPPKTAGLQAALLTGDRSGIFKAQEESLRDAGLAHMLAISGLHMGLLAGGAYFFASFGFSMIGPLARRYDMRKGAAIISIVFASVYLLMSGASVSTGRAYIMAVIMFAAVLLGRRAISLRSVAVAAGITLMLHPESLLSSGFQMSFAATTALVVVYRWWSARREFTPQYGFANRLWSGFKGLFVTSFVAGFATGGFAALHFHRFARYGLLTNLLAMPVFTFVVMPMGFIAILLMPFGLDGFALKIMGLGLEYILKISDWVGSLKGAVLYIKGANGLIISIFGLGFTLLCLGPAKLRWSGLVGITISLVLWKSVQHPDMRISQDARIAFWDPEDVRILRVDTVRADKFGRARFVEQSGIKKADIQSYFDTLALCDVQACRLSLKGQSITIVHEPEGVMEACLDSDVVILTLRSAGPLARRECVAVLLDTLDLEQSGAVDINFSNGKIDVRRANSVKRKNRPWGRK